MKTQRQVRRKATAKSPTKPARKRLASSPRPEASGHKPCQPSAATAEVPPPTSAAAGEVFTPPAPVRLVAWELTGPEGERELDPLIILEGPLFAAVMEQVNASGHHSLEQWLEEAIRAKLAPPVRLREEVRHLEDAKAAVAALFFALLHEVEQGRDGTVCNEETVHGLHQLTGHVTDLLDAHHARLEAHAGK